MKGRVKMGIEGKKLLLEASEIMELTGLSRSTVYQMLNRQDMPVVRIGGRKFMNAELFKKWIDDQCRINSLTGGSVNGEV